MSTSSNVSLGALRMAAQEEADLQSNNFVRTSEWNNYLNNSYKELYDILVSAYDNNYHFAPGYQFTLGGTQFYDLPDGTSNFLDVNGNTAPKFYKALGVDLQYSSSPTGWVTLKRFNFIDRNKYAWPNVPVLS